MPESTTGVAHARAGLLGNPSDAYGGKAIAFSIGDFSARVDIEPHDRLEFVAGDSDLMSFDSLSAAGQVFDRLGCDDGVRLLRVATWRFSRQFPDVRELAPSDPRLRFRMRYETDIPRQVGLSGSSAIVIGALRALASWFGRDIAPAALAELALAAEVEDLRIAAGPMDRVIQSYQGVLAMNFQEPRSDASYRALSAAALPPLFIAWDPAGGKASGIAHGEVRKRWLEGDPELRRAMAIFPRLVDEGLACLETGDHDRFRALMDQNFDTRTRFFPVSQRDLDLVAIGRGCGAAVKLCGSGGAVVGAPAARDDLEELGLAYARAGYTMLEPTFAASLHAPGAPGGADT